MPLQASHGNGFSLILYEAIALRQLMDAIFELLQREEEGGFGWSRVHRTRISATFGEKEKIL